MKALLVGSRAEELEPLAVALRERGHQLLTVRSDAEALAALRRDSPQMVFADLPAAAANNFALLRSIRQHESPTYVYSAVLAPGSGSDMLLSAYRAGADEDLRKPLSAESVAGCLIAAERVCMLPTAARGASKAGAVSGGAPESAGAPGPGALPLDAVCGAAAWRQAPEIMKAAAAKFLTLPVAIETAARNQGALGAACAISMASAQQQLELRIAIAADVLGARALAVHLFGDSGAELAEDMLAEVANMFMGALKAALNAANLAFAAGIPESIMPEMVLQPQPVFSRQESFVLAIADARLLVHVGVRSKARQTLAPMSLREGMVLTRDVFNARGMMLLNGGTRLSLNMIEHMQSILPPKHQIEVMAC